MRYRLLGATGIKVSEIGFGTWGIGGLTEADTSYGPTDDNESKRALRRAFDLGVTLYDTSDVYGYGHSEELIGEVFRGVREQIVIASKVGFLRHRGPQDFSPKYIRESLEKTLRRLRTDYLDIYQLHSPPIGDILNHPEAVETLEDLVEEQKIRAFGISLRTPDDGKVAIQKLRFRSLQVNFNMIDQRILENGVADLAKAEHVGLIARTPLNFGFLSGKLVGVTFDARDHRSHWPEAQLRRWAEAPQLFSFLYAKESGRTPVQAALQFCLSHPAVATVIPGMLTVKEVEENVGAIETFPLTTEECARIRDIYSKNEFFEKPKQ